MFSFILSLSQVSADNTNLKLNIVFPPAANNIFAIARTIKLTVKGNMWTCPRCKHKFYNTNQSHSCGSYTIEDFLKGKAKPAVDLFNYFISEYKKIGDLDIHPVKTRVALLTKMRFCSINKIGADYIDVHLVFTKPYNDNLCFYKIDNLADRFFVHHLKIYSKSDINTEVRKYMKLAYEIGNRKHVAEKKKSGDTRQ